MTINIIGGGIGGLTAAIALKQKGFQVQVFEQAQVLKPVGAGIILANNAMQVYDKLGLRQKLEAAGNAISAMNITTDKLKVLSGIGLGYFEKKYGVRNIAIHRGALQTILANELAKNEIILNKQLARVSKENNGFKLVFEDTSQVKAEVLIGADGISSVVRQQLFSENTIRKAEQICWRGVTEFDLPEAYQHAVNEAWGRGDRFGFVKIDDKRVYWFAVKSYKNSAEEFTISDIPAIYQSYHPLIQELIAATPIDTIYTNEIDDLAPINSWIQENVCLVGDAAHATTPNMGQGACQAIEDAYFLAEFMANKPINEAFTKFQQQRMAKAKLVVNQSWMIGKLAHVANPIGATFRNFMMKMTPESVGIKQSEKIFNLEG